MATGVLRKTVPPRYCPWCGEPLTDEARILSRGNVPDGAYSLLDEPEGVAASEDRTVATQWPNPPRGDAPIYNESSAPKRLSAKGRHKWTAAERRALSEKAKANWAARLAAKAAAAGEGEGDA